MCTRVTTAESDRRRKCWMPASNRYRRGPVSAAYPRTLLSFLPPLTRQAPPAVPPKRVGCPPVAALTTSSLGTTARYTLRDTADNLTGFDAQARDPSAMRGRALAWITRWARGCAVRSESLPAERQHGLVRTRGQMAMRQIIRTASGSHTPSGRPPMMDGDLMRRPLGGSTEKSFGGIVNVWRLSTSVSRRFSRSNDIRNRPACNTLWWIAPFISAGRRRASWWSMILPTSVIGCCSGSRGRCRKRNCTSSRRGCWNRGAPRPAERTRQAGADGLRATPARRGGAGSG